MRRTLLLALLLAVLSAPSTFAEPNPFSVYTVKEGDTVTSVARGHSIAPENLTAANGMAETDVFPPAGTVLLLPKSPGDVLATLYEAKRRGLGAWPKPRYDDEFLTPLTTEPAQAKAQPAVGESSAKKTDTPPLAAPLVNVPNGVAAHTIQEGETLYGISRTYGVSLAALLRANNLTESSIIRIGETLAIPDASEQKATPSQPTFRPESTPAVEKKPEPPLAPPTGLRLTWPLRGGPLPIHTGTSFGEGLSAKATSGEPVHAAADATVLHGGWMRNFGNAIFLNHGDGIATFYGGLGIIYVKSGEKVGRGARIALVGEIQGSEPRFVFHVLREGKSVDPTPWLDGAKH